MKESNWRASTPNICLSVWLHEFELSTCMILSVTTCIQLRTSFLGFSHIGPEDDLGRLFTAKRDRFVRFSILLSSSIHVHEQL